MTRFRPTDERELVEIISAAVSNETPLELLAGGSKRGLGNPVTAKHVLDLSAFAGIRQYEPEELVLTAGAATPLAEIEAVLAASHQQLAFEPPDWRHFWGSEDKAPTLGGTIACNLAGPRRIKDGAARDHFLGFHGVSGRGEAFKAGGRVVKNVTGYDLSKLMAGSYGTLAAFTEVTVKVLPAPEETRTVVLEGLDDVAAQRAMSEALGSPYEISGAAHLSAGMEASGNPPMTLLRLEGHKPSVEARADALVTLLRPQGDCDVMMRDESLALWRVVRDARGFAQMRDRVIWRVSVAPSAGPEIIAAIGRHLDVRHFFDWGGGLVWLAVAGAEDGGAAIIRGAVQRHGGHATLLRGDATLRETVPVFEPLDAATSALTRRVKDSFDAKRILNRGRLHREL